MNEIIEQDFKKQAFDLHYRLKSTAQVISNALADLCWQLKEMRDKKYYTALGYKDFSEYTEAEHDIKGRQAYNYISAYEKLGPQFIESNASFGITKLRLIADEVSPTDRTEFLNDNDNGSMTAEQLREKLKEAYGLHEQLSLQLDNVSAFPDVADEEITFDDINDRLRAADAARETAEAELAALKEAEVQSGKIDIDALRVEIIGELEIQMQEDALAMAESEKAKAVKQAKKEATREAEGKAKHEMAKKLEEMRVAALKEGEAKAREDIGIELANLEREKGEAAERAAKLEKELKLASSTESTAFALHFDQMQQHYAKMTEILEAMAAKGDEETAKKLSAALAKCLVALCEQLRSE